MIDAYYTPTLIANCMVGAIPETFKPRAVADFAAGLGSLLGAAARRWPHARLIANDIDSSVSRRLRNAQPKWVVSNSDFMCDTSSSRAAFAAFKGCVDVALINPPFSQRGIPPLTIPELGNEIRCGVATAFICKSLAFLSPKGYLVAVLPEGCLASDRDRKAWELIKQTYIVDSLGSNNPDAFPGVRPRTLVVRVSKRVNAKTPEQQEVSGQCSIVNGLKIIRGTCQMHTITERENINGQPLVHSTQLITGQVKLTAATRVQYGATIIGPAVLFPRVGRITPEKICVLRQHRRVVLSDCVMALECKDIAAAERIQSRILSSWEAFAAAYSGTGAPFITIARAVEVLKACLSVK